MGPPPYATHAKLLNFKDIFQYYYKFALEFNNKMPVTRYVHTSRGMSRAQDLAEQTLFIRRHLESLLALLTADNCWNHQIFKFTDQSLAEE